MNFNMVVLRFVRLASFLLLLAAGSTLHAQIPDDPDPYQLIAPNGGELEKRFSGEYVFHVRAPVTIYHGDLTLKGDEGWIYQQEEKAVLRGNVSIYDQERSLYADEAIYYKSQRKLILKKQIMISDLERNMIADEITYWRDSEKIEATGNVVLDDLRNDVTIQCHHVLYNGKLKMAEFDHKPVLMMRQTKKRPVKMTADYMQYFSREERALAIGNVIISESQTNAYCGQAQLFRKNDHLELTGNPVIVYTDEQIKSEVKGNVINLYFKDETLREVLISGDGAALYQPLAANPRVSIKASIDSFVKTNADTTVESPGQTLERTNFVSGDMIMMFMTNNAIRQVEIDGGARCVYFPETRSPMRPERNDVDGAHISLNLENGKVIQVSVFGQAVGTYAFPESNATKTENP